MSIILFALAATALMFAVGGAFSMMLDKVVDEKGCDIPDKERTEIDSAFVGGVKRLFALSPNKASVLFQINQEY